jgi:phosphatidate cytidylyltransferase
MSLNFKKRILTSLILLFILFLTFKFNYILAFSLLVLGVLSLIEFFNIINKIFKNSLYRLLINSTFVVYLSFFFILIFILSNIYHLKIIIFSILFGCVASDVGGYIFGKIFKGPKITKISPNKTFSGAIGSIILTCIVIALSIFYFTKSFSYNILIISLFTSIMCQLGDLLFSFLKRKAKIKDTGNTLPGHGGVLDRLDGLFLGIPTGFITLLLFY